MNNYRRRNKFQVAMNSGVAPAAGDPIGDALRAAATAYWNLSSVTDNTGRGNNGTLQNDAGFVEGKIGNALLCTTAGNGFMSVPNDTDLTLSATRYFAFWFKFANDASVYFVSKAVGSTEYVIDYSSVTDLLQFRFGSGGVTKAFTPNNEWHFLECYYNSLAAQVGIALDNGSFTTSEVFTITPNASEFEIGALEFTADDDVYMDELGIYGDILTQEQRDYLYNSGAGRTLYP